jgi:hypothetical protein
MLRGRMIPRKGTIGWTLPLLVVVVLFIPLACKRQSPTPLAATVSPAPPASPAPVSQPVGSPVELSIDGAPVAFPPVQLRATATGGGLSVRLTTPTANEESDNSLYFDLLLDEVDAAQDLPGASWHFRSDDSERSDTLNGIFLYGRQAVLEPRDVTISFSSEGSATIAEIEGRFRLFDPPDSEAEQKTVSVKGRFPVTMK